MPRGFILQPTYRVRSGKPVVVLYGRLEEGSPFLIEDDRFRPYFFLRRGHEGLVEKERELRVEASELRDLEGHALVRVTAAVPAALPPIRDRLQRAGAPVYEGDVRFAYRYLIDRRVRSSVEIRGEAQERNGLVRFYNPELAPADFRPSLTRLSIDIETTPDASQVFSIAMVGCGSEEVHLVSSRPVRGAVVHADEATLLEVSLARLRELDPDLILGWNVVDFDLRVLDRRCSELGLACHIGRGRSNEPIAFQHDLGFLRQSRASIPGRMVLDGIPLVRDALRLPDYRLETVSRAVLGRGKLIDAEAPDAAQEIQRQYREDPEALVAYNREDARLVLEILDQEQLLELSVERSLLTGMQLDRVSASIASFDRLYLPALRQRQRVAPSVIGERSGPVRGGAVLDSRPGVFRNVAVFDFKSLYPSLIRTFNLDPLAFYRGREEEDAIEAPNAARFSRRDAILPELVVDFMERREAAKLRGDRHADQAIKIMMNSLFGVLGASSCRFFEPEIANAITGFGQQTLAWTRDAFEERGVHVIYGDTDSVFVHLGTEEPGDAARAQAESLRDQVGAAIEARVRAEYAVEPRLDLELEKVFDRYFMPRLRRSSGGSKKRYAGWTGGQLEIVGLESVRRDWPPLARRLQEGMLERLFSDREVLPFVRELVEQLRKGELDDELVYVKRIRKGSLDRYTATTPPHVQAARKAGAELGRGGIIRYVITVQGPEPVLPGRSVPEGIERSHYMEKVMRPIADAILPEIGHSFDEALGLPQQMSLL